MCYEGAVVKGHKQATMFNDYLTAMSKLNQFYSSLAGLLYFSFTSSIYFDYLLYYESGMSLSLIC